MFSPNLMLLVWLLAAMLPYENPGQVVHTHVPLSPSSIIWHWPDRWEGYGSVWEVWPCSHMSELCSHSLPAQGLGNGDERVGRSTSVGRRAVREHCWLSPVQEKVGKRTSWAGKMDNVVRQVILHLWVDNLESWGRLSWPWVVLDAVSVPRWFTRLQL